MPEYTCRLGSEESKSAKHASGASLERLQRLPLETRNQLTLRLCVRQGSRVLKPLVRVLERERGIITLGIVLIDKPDE